MDFKYSCFISYRRGQHEFMKTFMEELTQALKGYLEPYFDIPVFIDDEQMQGGDILDKHLAHALCHSVCMIQVFTPKYFNPQKLYCTREFMAMENLEEQRFDVAEIPPDQRSFSFIIPIIFRAPEKVPQETKRHLYYDWSKYTMVEPKINNNKTYTDHIDQIVKRIDYLYEAFSQYDELHDCKKFLLPSEEEARKWLKKIRTSRNPTKLIPNFPGRR